MLDPEFLPPEEEQQLAHEESNEPPSASSRHSGGPNTPAGKARSSRNSLKHGCRSNALILPNEDPAELAALRDRWIEAYRPDTEAAYELVEQLVSAKWLLLRNERRYHEVEQQLSHFEYTKWNEGQHRIFQLTLRYKTAAERAASKALHELEAFFKNRRAEDLFRHRMMDREQATLLKMENDLYDAEDSLRNDLERAKERGDDTSALRDELSECRKRNDAVIAEARAAFQAFQRDQTPSPLLLPGQSSPRNLLAGINVLEQSVHVTVQKDGVALTQLAPSNEELLEIAQMLTPAPDVVFRRIHFPGPLPIEYSWVTHDPLLCETGGTGIQRMSFDTWLDQTDFEQLQPGGHLLPCLDSLPSARVSSVSDCPACDSLRARIRAFTRPEGPPARRS